MLLLVNSWTSLNMTTQLSPNQLMRSDNILLTQFMRSIISVNLHFAGQE